MIDLSNQYQDLADEYDESADYWYYSYSYSEVDSWWADAYERRALQIGVAGSALIALVVFCLFIVYLNIRLTSALNLTAIKGSGYEKLYTISCVLVIVAILVYLLTISLANDYWIEYHAMRYILSMVYGPSVICYDILSHRW